MEKRKAAGGRRVRIRVPRKENSQSFGSLAHTVFSLLLRKQKRKECSAYSHKVYTANRFVKYNFDEAFARSPFSCKWLDGKDGIIPMTVADMDFPLMPEVCQAVKEAVDNRDFGYQFMQEHHYEAILNWIKNHAGDDVPREHIIDTPGVLYTMRCSMYALTKPGDKIVIQTPLHTPSIKSASMMGRIPMMNRLVYKDGQYTMDFDHLEQCFKDGAKVLMMCAPNNPTGRVWTKQEMDTVAYLANKYNVYIVADEIHRDILWNGVKHISPTAMDSIKDRSVGVISTSKTFNMGGFHIGTAIIPNETIRQKVKDQIYAFGYSCGMPAVIDREAQTAAYTKGEVWYKEMLSYVEGNLDLALEYLDGLPITAKKPEGTFILWIDIQELGLDNDGLWNLMRNEWKVLGDPGSFYDTKDYLDYKGPEHHVRLNLATQRKLVETAFDRIRKSFLA